MVQVRVVLRVVNIIQIQWTPGATTNDYDAAYAFWKQTEFNIPSTYRGANTVIKLKQTITQSGSEQYQTTPAEDPNAFDMMGIAQIMLMGGFCGVDWWCVINWCH